MTYERPHALTLRLRLNEPPSFMNVITGPRQIGKSTMVRQVLANRNAMFISVDNPLLADPFNENLTTQVIPGAEPTPEWLVHQWSIARNKAKNTPNGSPFILAIDEIQKINRWSEIIKGLWDADRGMDLNMHVVLLGSSPWLLQQGLTESLAGRYELIQMSHWSYSEMQDAFNFSLDEYVYFGGYPGCANLIQDERRWRSYILSSLIKPNIEKDILQMTRVDKPALLKAVFELGCQYSGQIISYTKLVGQLQYAGNTVTIAHYLDLLSRAGLLTGLPKYAGQKHRQRASSPKLIALNTGLISALHSYSFTEAKADRSHWGRLVESVIGAHLCNTASDNREIQYWREGSDEVDFIITSSHKIIALEVKSGQGYRQPKGLTGFIDRFKCNKAFIIGEGGISISEFLSKPALFWLE